MREERIQTTAAVNWGAFCSLLILIFGRQVHVHNYDACGDRPLSWIFRVHFRMSARNVPTSAVLALHKHIFTLVVI